METILKNFINQSLYDASAEMLKYLRIRFTPQSNAPIPFQDLYFGATSQNPPKLLAEILAKVKDTYFIGSIDEESLEGKSSEVELSILDEDYLAMMVFAVDMKNGESLTRSEIATLTRGFNRMANSVPVILFVKSGDRLSLATCERSKYKQEWRSGEKLGRVSILRDINLNDPHRGHQDILKSLRGEKSLSSFDELYRHWLEVFSSELLTKKFYTELSEWYAWVINSGKVKFPNDIRTTEDDMKYNHEAVIRLITRLIFVWFLKQKKLIPEEFFDEKAIAENFIEDFDPHHEKTLLYDAEDSKYYRLILQNLFFAMLNRPIVDEDSGKDENRRFRRKGSFQGKNPDFNINNLMRYESEFKEGGAQRLLEIANSKIPFLNGGLFECLDHKDKDDPECGMYYDGFTENKVALSQLAFPDYFFFGDEVGKDVDLSVWYDDENKKHQKIRGIINILSRYNFTVEENTPLDQEVSLDPELLGKVFENLLASYNPETKTTARKQTGSFYTPRHIVQFMVDESLIEYLKTTCPNVSESMLRNLFEYNEEVLDISNEERTELISALHSCKVLDPACGSGAFPMGILQQMVHVLRKLDPTNANWKEFILEIALGKDREAYKIQDEEERTNRRRDIEESFNRNINDPDYARKLYLIENCIYGNDIQAIATQISKLRFFISLVAEQRPSNDSRNNFNIRPLPNLEAKFVSADTLVPLKKSDDLFSNSDYILNLKSQLAEENHKLFIARSNSKKNLIKKEIKRIRHEYSEELKAMGIIPSDSAALLASWDPFDQNHHAHFLDSEWMFDIKEGFDIVIGNPPYVEVKNSDAYKDYETASSYELYAHFFERGIKLLKINGILSFITGSLYIKGMKFHSLREFLRNNTKLIRFRNEGDNVFEEVGMPTSTIILSSGKRECNWPFDGNKLVQYIAASHPLLGDLCSVQRGLEIGKKLLLKEGPIEILTGKNVSRFIPKSVSYISKDTLEKYAKNSSFYEGERFTIRETGSDLTVTYLNYPIYVTRSLYTFKCGNNTPSIKFLVGCLSSKLMQYYYSEKFKAPTELFPKIRIGQAKLLPIALPSLEEDKRISSIVSQIILSAENNCLNKDLLKSLNILIYRIYHINYDDINSIDPDIDFSREEYESFQ